MAKICKLDYKRHKYEDAGLLSCPLSWNEKLVEDDETADILKCDDIVCLIIGGTQFQIMKSKFAYWPQTRLSKLIRAENEDEMLLYCDKVIFSCQSPQMPEKFVFLRSGTNFNSILDKCNNTFIKPIILGK